MYIVGSEELPVSRDGEGEKEQALLSNPTFNPEIDDSDMRVETNWRRKMK